MENEPVKRRTFLKAGVGVALAGIVPLKKLLGVSDDPAGFENSVSTQTQKNIHEIIQKYGGEFGDIKPESRRRNHGYI